MTVDTFYPTTGTTCGYLRSDNATYATARSGGTMTLNSANYLAGQYTGYTLYETFFGFDTSSIPDTNVISEAVLSIYVATDSSGVDFTIEARLNDYGATFTTADWVPGADLSGKTLCASVSTAGISVVQYTPMTSTADLLTSISKTGVTRFVLCSDTLTAGNQPATSDRVILGFYTTQRPKLVVTHAAAATGINTQVNIGNAWKAATAAQINIGGAWKPVTNIQQNIGGAWKVVK